MCTALAAVRHRAAALFYYVRHYAPCDVNTSRLEVLVHRMPNLQEEAVLTLECAVQFEVLTFRHPYTVSVTDIPHPVSERPQGLRDLLCDIDVHLELDNSGWHCKNSSYLTCCHSACMAQKIVCIMSHLLWEMQSCGSA